jgi:DNA-nicking Smr family endonuclease
MPDQPTRVPIEGELDLHSFAPRDIPSVVAEYVHAAAAAGFHEIRLVHGRGQGVQRGIVQAALERHPLVAAFWDDPASHLGATMARLAAQDSRGSKGSRGSRGSPGSPGSPGSKGS